MMEDKCFECERGDSKDVAYVYICPYHQVIYHQYEQVMKILKNVVYENMTHEEIVQIWVRIKDENN